MGFDKFFEIRSLSDRQMRGKLGAAPPPTPQPALIQETRCQWMVGRTPRGGEGDGCLRFGAGAGTRCDKKACQQERDAHGGSSGVGVKLGGVSQTALVNARECLGSPKHRIGFVRERIVENNVGSRRRCDQVAKIAFKKIPAEPGRPVLPLTGVENLEWRAVPQVRKDAGTVGRKRQRIEIPFEADEPQGTKVGCTLRCATPFKTAYRRHGVERGAEPNVPNYQFFVAAALRKAISERRLLDVELVCFVAGRTYRVHHFT